MYTTHTFRGSSDTGAMMWFFQRITGLFLAVFLLGHFVYQHMWAEDPQMGQLTYESVGSTLVNPIWKTVEIVFLVCALFHGMHGLWMIACDYVHTGWVRVSLSIVLSMAALVVLVLGMVTILPFSVAIN